MEAVFAMGLLMLLFSSIAAVAGKFLLALIFFIIGIVAISYTVYYVFSM